MVFHDLINNRDIFANIINNLDYLSIISLLIAEPRIYSLIKNKIDLNIKNYLIKYFEKLGVFYPQRFIFYGISLLNSLKNIDNNFYCFYDNHLKTFGIFKIENNKFNALFDNITTAIKAELYIYLFPVWYDNKLRYVNLNNLINKIIRFNSKMKFDFINIIYTKYININRNVIADLVDEEIEEFKRQGFKFDYSMYK